MGCTHLVQLGVNKPTVNTVAAQLQSDSRALRHDLKLRGDFRRKPLVTPLTLNGWHSVTIHICRLIK